MTRKPWADKGSRQARGYGAAWDRLRKQILARDNYLCQACLRAAKVTALCMKPRDHAVDHIKPKAQGGTDHPSNLESLCSDCHDTKTDRDEGRLRRREVGLDGYPVHGRR